jgi:hypothetical protein
MHRRTAAETGIPWILGNNWENVAVISASPSKIFQIIKNFVCICGKMGYNKKV